MSVGGPFPLMVLGYCFSGFGAAFQVVDLDFTVSFVLLTGSSEARSSKRVN